MSEEKLFGQKVTAALDIVTSEGKIDEGTPFLVVGGPRGREGLPGVWYNLQFLNDPNLRYVELMRGQFELV